MTGGLFGNRTSSKGLNFGKSKRVTAATLRAWRDHNRRLADRATESPGPASAGPELPNPAALPEAAGVTAGSKFDSGTNPTGTGGST